jgi:hypothetical protein
MEIGAADILGKRILLGRGRHAAIDDAGDRLVLRQPLLLDEHAEREIAAAAGGHFERASLFTYLVQHGTDVQALKELAVPPSIRRSLPVTKPESGRED